MDVKLILRVLVIDIVLPVAAGSIVWRVLHEPLSGLIVTLLAVNISLAAQIYVALHRAKGQATLFTSLETLVSNANALWNRAHGIELFRFLLSDKVAKLANDLGPTSLYSKQDEIQDRGILLVKQMRSGAFLTFLASLQDYWNTVSPYFRETRAAASSKNRQITRVFICDTNALQNRVLLQQMSEDEQAHIKAYIVLTEEVSDKEILKDFGIWDNRILALVEREAAGGTAVGCEYTTDETRLRMAEEWRERLMRYAKPPRDLLGRRIPVDVSGNLKELQESARFTEERAQDCSSTFLGGPSCSWYHGAWQYLRLLDMVASPDWHRDFYRNSLIDVLQNHRNARILICGIADHGMLNHVADAINAVQARPEIMVLDICPTPLAACQWYATRHNLSINSICENLITSRLEEPSFDLIVTDEFLTVVSPFSKHAVLRKWQQVLKMGGKVVTTAMAGGRSGGDAGWATPQERQQQYVERACKRAVERAALVWPQLAGDQIQEVARGYASQMTNYTIDGEEEVQTLFQGFAIRQMNHRSVPGEFVCPTDSLEIVAEKTSAEV